MLSTGTAGYNDDKYDNCPPEISLNIPSALLDIDSFKRADNAVRAAFPSISERPLTILDGGDTFAEVLRRECSLFGYCVAFDRGKLRLKSVYDPELKDALVTLDDSNHATYDAMPDVETSVDTVINQRTFVINHNPFNGEKRTITVSDRESIEGLGGIVKSVKLDHPGVRPVGVGQVTPAMVAELTALTLQASHILRYPAQRIRRTLSPPLFNRVFVGDVVPVSASYGHPDPMGSGDMSISTIGIVLDVKWNYESLTGDVDLLLYSRYDWLNATPWAPAALVDRTASNAGWTVGTKTLTLIAREFGSSSADSHDGATFAEDQALMIIERDPADPTSPATIACTVDSAEYDTATRALVIKEDISGSFDTTGATEYLITFADWGSATAAQKLLGTWHASPTTHLLGASDSALRHG